MKTNNQMLVQNYMLRGKQLTFEDNDPNISVKHNRSCQYIEFLKAIAVGETLKPDFLSRYSVVTLRSLQNSKAGDFKFFLEIILIEQF